MKKGNQLTKTDEKKRPNLYDYLKIVAIVTMVIDHVWYYFFPDALWLRLIGRIAFPIFLFLVWFSWSYKRRWDIVLLWVVLWVATAFSFQAIGIPQIPTANILIGIAITRAVLSLVQKFEKWIMDMIIVTVCISVVGYFAHPYLNLVIQYGAISIVFWLWWYIAKYHKSIFPYGILVLIAHFMMSMWVFPFGKIAGSNYMPTTLWCFFMILYAVFYRISRNNTPLVTNSKRDAIALFISNHALSIFAIHILVFLVIFVVIW